MKNRILRSALSVALCAAMLLSQGLTVFADGEIDLAAAKSSPVQESSEESEAKTPAETLTPETKKELPASTEDETKTETTTGQPTAEDDTAKETTAKTPAVVSEEEKSEEATAAPAEAQAATNSLKSNWGNGCPEEKTRDIKIEIACDAFDKDNFISFIEQSVKVQIECVNENRLHNSETITWPLKEGSYSRGYWKIDGVVVNEQGGCTATITVDPSYYLDAYNKDNGEHYLVLHNSILSLAFNFNAASKTWEPVEQHDFYLPVTCEGPNIPSHEDVIKLLGGTMTVHCVNTNHNATETYGITWDSIGGLNKAPTDNGDGTYSLEITVSHDTYLKLFNQTYPNHKWATDDDMENEKVTLIWKDGEWSVEGKTDFSFNVDCNATAPGGDENPDNPGGGDNGNNGGNNNGGSTGGGSSVSRRDDDDDWEPLPNNNYRVTKKNNKPSQNTQIVVRDPADNSDNTSSNTGSDSGKHNPETGDTTTAFAAMALAAVSLGGVVLLGRKKK